MTKYSLDYLRFKSLTSFRQNDIIKMAIVSIVIIVPIVKKDFVA